MMILADGLTSEGLRNAEQYDRYTLWSIDFKQNMTIYNQTSPYNANCMIHELQKIIMKGGVTQVVISYNDGGQKCSREINEDAEYFAWDIFNGSNELLKSYLENNP